MVTLPDSVAMVVMNPYGVVREMNRVAEELLGRNMQDFVRKLIGWHPEDGVVMDFNNRRIRLDMLKTSHANYVMLFDLNAQEKLERCVEHQRREIEMLQGGLQQEQELLVVKEKFTAMIAHEFGTPLSTIRMKSDLIKKYLDQASKEKIVHHLDQIDTQITHMVDLLDDLLLINQVNTRQGIIPAELLNLEAFCKQILNQIALRWEGTQITLTCAGELDNVQLDRRLIRYVLSNLLSNAVKYSPDGGEIRLEVRATQEEVVFTVRDHGVGIPSEEIGKIFTQFYRASNVSGFKGMGLGLAVMKTCVEMYGGTIKVDSQLGEGTTFVVSLPLHIL